MRMLIAQALRLYPTTSLYPFLEDRSILVRTAAARQIPNRGERASFDRAITLLADKRASLREIAVFILGQLGTPEYPYKSESVARIAERLSTDSSSMVKAAAALGHVTAYQALPQLIPPSPHELCCPAEISIDS